MAKQQLMFHKENSTVKTKQIYNKKSFQSKANRPLIIRYGACDGHQVNKFEHVGGGGVKQGGDLCDISRGDPPVNR